jgi:hypothetical protein
VRRPCLRGWDTGVLFFRLVSAQQQEEVGPGVLWLRYGGLSSYVSVTDYGG